MALVPGQSTGKGAWQILPLLFPGCVTLGKPLPLSEHLDPHLENAYHQGLMEGPRGMISVDML